jgi:plastocyanin
MQAEAGRGSRALTRVLAVVLAAVTGAVAIVLRDPDAALITVGLIVGIVLLKRLPALGSIVVSLLFALTLFWCGVGAFVNFGHRAGFSAELLTSVPAVLAAAGLVSLVAPHGFHRPLALTTVTLVVAAALTSVVLPRSASTSRPGDLRVVTQRLRFVPNRVEARAGRITIDLKNRDFFWHTFTVSKLRVNLDVTTRGQSRVTFEARRGTYTFICLIHEGAGMKGTLIVR